MPREDAQKQAIAQAWGALAGVDMPKRCRDLGLPACLEGCLQLRLFGSNADLNLTDRTLCDTATGNPARPADMILLLHYLACDLPFKRTQTLDSYRAFPGGQFYYQPFKARTTEPLVKRFADDVDALRRNLDRFDWTPFDGGDLGARIHAFGHLSIVLIYRTGEDEFPASADVLFDAALRHVVSTEDAAVLASRICIGLL